MPTINPTLIPSVAPGSLFSRLTSDQSLNVRFLAATDPATYAILNRPLADIVVRQLVLAKSLDNLDQALGHQVLFPFLVQAQVANGSTILDIPIGWIWDLQMSLPAKWQSAKLAKIKRISGINSTTDGYSGKLRFIFTAQQGEAGTEVAIFYVDYTIDSDLSYQSIALIPTTTAEETLTISSGELQTISGRITFKTLDITDDTAQALFDLLAPVNVTDSNNDGIYDNPSVYETVDTSAGGPSITGDFATSSISHGTGLLADSVWSPIPSLDSDVQSWVDSFNYPFSANANRLSANNITIPIGLFKEFDITAPAGDQPTGDTSGTFYPVWISRIERVGTGTSQLRFFFATYNVTDVETGGSPSTTAVEFATLDLLDSYTENTIVDILPLNNLQLQSGADWGQHFGRGHVVLSSLWDGTTPTVDNFFLAFGAIIDNPADTSYSLSAARLSSFGISRVSKYTPTIGQARALAGTTSDRVVPIPPGVDNKYVTEQDEGLGDQIDLESFTSITADPAIDRFGYTGGLVRKLVKLVVDSTLIDNNNTDYYTEQMLPRLTILLGRAPLFGDVLYNGTVFFTFNGDSWQSG